MDQRKGLSGASEGGLKAARVAPRARDAGLEMPRGRAAALAEHRRRRVQLASTLLAVALLLGLVWLGFYLGVIFPSPATPAAFDGTVIDAATRDPVVNATVVYAPLNLSDATDASGNFSMHGLPSGHLELVVLAPGYPTTTFSVFANPEPAGATTAPVREQMVLTQGTGSAAVDLTQTRSGVALFCTALFAIGDVLTALGFVATLSRRRYQHAMLGGIGAVFAVGFFAGALLGLVAVVLLRGAREEFANPRGLFAPGGAPALLEANDEEGAEDEGEEEQEGGADGGQPEGGSSGAEGGAARDGDGGKGKVGGSPAKPPAGPGAPP